MKRAGLFAVVLLSMLLVAPAMPAQASGSEVHAYDSYFSPETFTVGTPGFPTPAVDFYNAGALTHTATQDAPFRLWNTGDILTLTPVASTAADWAGSFKYHCIYHSEMRGSIRVPVRLSSSVATVGGGPIDVKVAEKAAPAKMKYESQVMRGSGDWKPLGLAQKPTITFTPTKTGVFDFRSRVVKIRKTKKDQHTGWSPSDPLISQVVVSPAP
jgi:plastocyanin